MLQSWFGLQLSQAFSGDMHGHIRGRDLLDLLLPLQGLAVKAQPTCWQSPWGELAPASPGLCRALPTAPSSRGRMHQGACFGQEAAAKLFTRFIKALKNLFALSTISPSCRGIRSFECLLSTLYRKALERQGKMRQKRGFITWEDDWIT